MCLCWVDEKFDAHEDFIVGSVGANVLVGALKNVLLRLNLCVVNCRG